MTPPAKREKRELQCYKKFRDINATDRTEGRYFFDAFLVVCDFISRMTLLTKPEDPAAKKKK